MDIEFDDLIPANASQESGGIEFDDLIPAQSRQTTLVDNARDLAAAILKIGPTAAKSVGDVTQLATGGNYGDGISSTMERGMQSIDEVVGSDELHRQQAAFNDVMQDPSKGIADILAAAAENKRATLNSGIATAGSMALPLGAAKGVVALSKAAPALQAARATAAATGANAAMNAGDTFTSIQSDDLGDKYSGAGISAAASLLGGKLTGGGAEGSLARRLTDTPTVKGVLAKIFGTAGKEGAQEVIEEGGNFLGEMAGDNKPFDANSLGKRAAFSGLLGAILGGTTGTGEAIADARKGEPVPPLARAPESAAPAPAAAEPDTAATVENLVNLIKQTAEQPSALPVASAPKQETQNVSAKLPPDVAGDGPGAESNLPNGSAPGGAGSVEARPLPAERGDILPASNEGDRKGGTVERTADQPTPALSENLNAENANTLQNITNNAPETAPRADAAQAAPANAQAAPVEAAPAAAPQPNAVPVPAAAKPKKPKKIKPAKTAAELADRYRLSLLAEIRKLGGIELTEKRDILGEGRRSSAGGSTLSLFRKGGVPIDMVRERLGELGFFPDGSTGDITGDAEQVRQLVRAAIEGRSEETMPMDARGEYQDMLKAEKEESDRLGEEEERASLVAGHEAVARDAERLLPPDEIERLAVKHENDHDYFAALKEAVDAARIQESESVPQDDPRTRAQAQPAGRGPLPAQDEGVGAGQPAGDAGSPAAAAPAAARDEPLLKSQTEQDIIDRLDRIEKAQQEQAKQAKAEQDTAKANKERDNFTLTGSDRPADVAMAGGQQDLLSQPSAKSANSSKSAKSEPTPQPKTDTKIQDFGEKIGGARKDVWTSFKDELGAVSDDEIESQPFSKVWPAPDYQALIDGGADPWVVGFIRAARDEVPAKPRKSYRVTRWAKQVRELRGMATKLLSGELPPHIVKAKLDASFSYELAKVAGRVDLYVAVGHSKSLEGVTLSKHEYTLYQGQKFDPPKTVWAIEKRSAATAWSNWPRELATADTREEAIQKFKEKIASLDIGEKSKKDISFDIYSRRGVEGFLIGKKLGRNHVDLAGPFKTVKEARDHKAAKQAELVEKLEKAKQIPKERRDSNTPRVGEDMRNGQDVTPELFGNTFGFRGVEFGNWVEQGKRQKDLNNAFDALMDMAAILGVPPKAISLNGELGLAFGARGSGGINPASAHYEPGKVVINLTKKEGAGSLGHEWFHALDNYFSRKRPGWKTSYMMDDASVSLASRGSPFIPAGGEAVRKEMYLAFGAVKKAIYDTAIKARSEQLDGRRSKPYWATDTEMAARAFESYLIAKLQDQGASNDYLANIIDEATWEAAIALGFETGSSYPYPTAGEIPKIRAGFDHFIDTLETRETEQGTTEIYEPTSVYASQLPLDFGDGQTIDLSDVATRDGTEPRQARTGIAAVKDLLALRDRRAGAAVLVDGLTKDFEEVGHTKLVGQKVTNPAELAALAQVYRDPRFETFRVFFMKDGKIVHQTGVSSRLAGASSILPRGMTPDAYAKQFDDQMALYGADGYWLSHNHPTGRADASDADLGVTLGLAKNVAGFLGHVIIDHNEYGVIEVKNDKAVSKVVKHDFGGYDPKNSPRIPGPLLGKQLINPAQLANAAKQLQQKSGYATVIATTAAGNVQAIVEFPQHLLENDLTWSKARLKRLTSASGSGGHIFIVTEGSAKKLAALAEAGLVTDIYGSDVPDNMRRGQSSFGQIRTANVGEKPADQTETPAFRKWFGASKVVDADGKPLVVYHGTDKDFEQFDTMDFGSWFAVDPETSNNYVEKSGEGDPRSIPVFLAIKNPLVVPENIDLSDDHVVQDTLDAINKENGTNITAEDIGFEPDYEGSAFEWIASEEKFILAAKALGFDGLRAWEAGSETWNAFEEGQIKSAIGNNGNFDANDSSIVRDDRSQYDEYANQDADTEQAQLDLKTPKRNFEPIRAKDFVSLEKNKAGRRELVAGRKLYDRVSAYATDWLGKVKLADTTPQSFRNMMRQFRIDKSRASVNAKDLAEAGQGLSAEQRAMLSDLVENQAKVGDVPPQQVVELASSIASALEAQAKQLVELGMLSPERLVKNYLPRLYQHGLAAKLQNPALLRGWFTKMRLKIRGDRLKSRGMLEQMDTKTAKEAMKLGWKVSSMSDGSDVPAQLFEAFDKSQPIPPQYRDTKVLMWRDYTASEREEMGEIRDGVLRYAIGYVETQKDIAIGRLFKAIAENPELSSDHNPGGWVKVPGNEVPGAGGVKAYGILAGKYVPTQVYDSLTRNTQPKGALMAMYDKALSFWKEGKTVWNPVSHGNNVISNLFTAYFAGVNPANPARWRETIREFRTEGSHYREAVENGLFGVEYVNNDIQDLLMPDLSQTSDMETLATSRLAKVIELAKKYPGKPITWYRERMQKAYEFEDRFFKLMLFIDRRKQGMSAEEAITDTERYVFNYADVPEGVEMLKRTYSPFFTYTYKAIPMVIHTALTRPDRMLMPIALLGGANWLAYLFLGDGADEDKERAGMPEYLRGRSAIGTHKAIRMPFNVEGRPAFMDVSRRVPLGDLFDVRNETGGLPILAPFMPSHPVISMIQAVIYNQDTFTGKDLVKKSDTSWEAAEARAGYMIKQMTPNAPFVPGSFNFNKLMDAAAYTFDTEIGPYTGRTKAGDPIKPLPAIADVFTGTKIRSFDTERGIGYQQAGLSREEQEIRANIRSATRNQAMSSSARESYIAGQEKKLERLREQRDQAGK